MKELIRIKLEEWSLADLMKVLKNKTIKSKIKRRKQEEEVSSEVSSCK